MGSAVAEGPHLFPHYQHRIRLHYTPSLYFLTHCVAQQQQHLGVFSRPHRAFRAQFLPFWPALLLTLLDSLHFQAGRPLCTVRIT
mmetsp:Transcript_23357/g.33408  ORF Transcript_23357/g.33408 Transcript_23357/m.33408 type:complete len:85 (-) Transcript_23357:103-357(-)